MSKYGEPLRLVRHIVSTNSVEKTKFGFYSDSNGSRGMQFFLDAPWLEESKQVELAKRIVAALNLVEGIETDRIQHIRPVDDEPVSKSNPKEYA